MKKVPILGIVVVFLIFSCQPTVENTAEESETIMETFSGDSIVKLAIKAHCGDKYDEANFQFTFRDKVYQFTNFGKQYQYSRQQVIEGDTILDILSNYSFERIINGNSIKLEEKETSKHTESINSVIYFATLPHKLGDEAVIKDYKGQVTIKNELYNAIEVSFNAEGGGKDYEDIFYYWFNTKTNQVDYLAYQYSTNRGGVRFRVAYNKQEIGGVIFQDYVNFSAPISTQLKDLPKMFTSDKLIEISRVETENISALLSPEHVF